MQSNIILQKNYHKIAGYNGVNLHLTDTPPCPNDTIHVLLNVVAVHLNVCNTPPFYVGLWLTCLFLPSSNIRFDTRIKYRDAEKRNA